MLGWCVADGVKASGLAARKKSQHGHARVVESKRQPDFFRFKLFLLLTFGKDGPRGLKLVQREIENIDGCNRCVQGAILQFSAVFQSCRNTFSG